VEGPFALVGFSWGATVGLRISPERLRALALIDVGYQSGGDEPQGYGELLAECADADFAPPGAVAAGFEGVGLEPASAALENVRGLPVLLLAATVPHVERRPDDLARFAATLPGAEIKMIEGAEHNVLGTAPEEAIPLLMDFLRRRA
jgi:pimeloyl-ACP methyl ester carboxylesterase